MDERLRGACETADSRPNERKYNSGIARRKAATDPSAVGWKDGNHRDIRDRSGKTGRQSVTQLDATSRGRGARTLRGCRLFSELRWNRSYASGPNHRPARRSDDRGEHCGTGFPKLDSDLWIP